MVAVGVQKAGLRHGAAKIAGLLALFLGVVGAAPARRRHWRINPAPGRAKTSDFVVFAHRRRPALGCIARALTALVRFLALPLLLIRFLAQNEVGIALALAGCQLRVLIARRRRRRRRRDGNRRRRRRRRDGNRRRRRRDGNRRRRRRRRRDGNRRRRRRRLLRCGRRRGQGRRRAGRRQRRRRGRRRAGRRRAGRQIRRRGGRRG